MKIDRIFQLIGLGLVGLTVLDSVSPYKDDFDLELFDNDLSTITDLKPGPDKGDTCPPCFNCNLANFECKQFSMCNTFTGMCECREGFGGNDCSEPLCGSLADGQNGRPVRGEKEKSCKCKDGWGGINCNVCLQDSVCDSFLPGDLKGTCYDQGIIVNKFHQMCDVTNKKIVQILDGKKPQVTFTCNKTAEACNFQFWILEKESFYCDLSTCDFQYELKDNSTHYKCQDVQCKCLPDRMLCGESGSIDISDFLTETIKGPGDFSCDLASKNCKFSEPSMNDLIMSVFGDSSIFLHCASGECIHSSEIPGYELPGKSKMTLRLILTLISALVFLLGFLLLSIWGIKQSPLFATQSLDTTAALAAQQDEEDLAMANHIPAVFSFQNVSYSVQNGKKILKKAFGSVGPGECLAIMGGSGAGKTTLLDILAYKNKNGVKEASLYVNGEEIKSAQDVSRYRKIIGFVDQEDYLIPTLTVYETVLNSALLRLPRNMSLEAKKLKVFDILTELRIYHIRDKVIGSDFERGISGGEKRRVAIACELVTSPSILFLDEPTSGLDAFNAKNVVDSLIRLSHDYQRTVIFTIHQPRSNIVALFDKLVLLSEGETVYSGNMLACGEFFALKGFKCPVGYNIADYLIDLTSVDEKSKVSIDSSLDEESRSFGDEEAADHDIHNVGPQDDDDPTREWEHYAVHRDEYISSSQVLKKRHASPATLENQRINSLFKESLQAEQLHAEIKELNDRFNDASDNSLVSILQSKPNFSRASFLSQLIILSSRTFKNLYRNPKLLLTQYVLSLGVALFCGYLYYDISNDISGFQNRLGLFFFLLTFLGFSTLTGLHSFSVERIVFIRERSNNYYHSLSYYISKIICDVLPLRLIPPFLLTVIIYPLVGLNMEENTFLKCTLILVLFNLATAVEILIIGILIKDPGNATLLGVLVLLFSLLFAGLFINQETIPIQIEWLQNLSVFHYGYEALIVNEVRTLTLKERKYGLDIEVPGAVILSTFGFDVGAYWFDVYWLSGMFAVFLVLGYVGLHYFVYEKR